MLVTLSAEQAAALVELLPQHPGGVRIESASEHGLAGGSRVVVFRDGERFELPVRGT